MRKILIVLLAGTVLLLVGYAAYRGYKVYKQERMVKLARQFIAKNDVRNATLALRQALASNPKNVEALRLAAQLDEAGGSPEALYLRSRVVDLNPGSLDDRLSLAAVAVALNDLERATNALARVSESGRKTFAYHNAVGSVAVAAARAAGEASRRAAQMSQYAGQAVVQAQEKNKPAEAASLRAEATNQLAEASSQYAQAFRHLAEAEEHFQEAAKLEPANLVSQLNLAIVRLHQTNEQAQSQGRLALNDLRSKPELRCQALRELADDALRHARTNDALALSLELIQQTNSVFRDKLTHLVVLRLVRSPEFDSTLAGFQAKAGTNQAEAYQLGAWEMQVLTNGPSKALRWLTSLPDQTTTNPPVAILVADCRSILKDWPGLQKTVENQNWGPYEFSRHALLARALRGQGLTDSSKTEWGQAVTAVTGNLAGMRDLLRLAKNWGWPVETEELLSSIVNQYPKETWAYQSLGKLLYAQGRTRSLMSLFNQQAKSKPSDLETKNNLAMIALLLNAEEVRPNTLAAEAYKATPTNRSFASTYAFSLYCQTNYPDALKVMETLEPADLERDSIAGYYGLILLKCGDTNTAQRYLDLGLAAKVQLPEERKLFEQAKAAPANR
jgi:tetratricopeptide (TPR) repeat protein